MRGGGWGRGEGGEEEGLGERGREEEYETESIDGIDTSRALIDYSAALNMISGDVRGREGPAERRPVGGDWGSVT